MRVMDFEREVSGAAPDGAFLRDFGEDDRQAGTKAPPPRGRLFWVAVLAGCALGGMVLSRSRGQGPVAAPASPAFSQISFVADERLAPMIAFSAPEDGPLPAHYVARSRAATGERWDTLTFGAPDGGDLLFRITLRSATSPLAGSSLFVALAKQSAELGAAVIHATSPQPDETARGPIEWADITLSGRKGERPCLGFRTTRAAAIDLSGFACGGRGAPLDRAALECLIDRLDPTKAGLESGLGEALKSEASRRAACPRVVG
jgi:hypothetical protein